MTEPLTWRNETRRLSELVPYPDNPRSIDDEQGKRLVRSREKFAQPWPIVIGPSNELFDGHQRLDKWGEKWGLDLEVAVRVASRALSEAERKELVVLAHDGAVGEFDPDLLLDWDVETDELEEWGLSDELLAGLLEAAEDEPPAPEAQMSKADELQEKWNVQTGDLWEIGAHRLICGDCTDVEVVERVMGGGLATLVVTDPPYNCAGDGRNYAANVMQSYADLRDSEWDKGFNPQESLGVLLSSVLANDVTVYVFTSHFLFGEIISWAATWSDFHSRCVWVKPNPTPSLSKRHWTWADELIVYATRGRHIFNFPSDGHALNWWDVAKTIHKSGHPTEKPIEIIEIPIEKSSNRNDIVFDGFAGSGTTGVACQNTGRRARLVEIEPKYCAVILQRFSDMGLTPTLIKDAPSNYIGSDMAIAAKSNEV